jgi:hypothetical protein
MKTVAHNIPVTIEQILNWLSQCNEQEKKAILSELLNSSKSTMLASEPSLTKDWLGKEEDDAWKNL